MSEPTTWADVGAIAAIMLGMVGMFWAIAWSDRNR